MARIIEEHRDLFSVDNNIYYYAHCISNDFALGAGIAREINARYNMREKLFNVIEFNNKKYVYSIIGECILIDHIFNLITKKNYWNKPTYESLEKSLISMRKICENNRDIKNIAMPTIGCGLDRLNWLRVKNIIRKVFEYSDVEILICIK